MVNLRQPGDVAQILLSVLFLAIMIIACLWIVRPFVLGFAGRDRRRRHRLYSYVCRNCCLVAAARRAGDDAAVVPAVYYSHCTTG